MPVQLPLPVASLRKLARAGVASYHEEPRSEWVLHQPAQLVIVVSQIFWCQVGSLIQHMWGVITSHTARVGRHIVSYSTCGVSYRASLRRGAVWGQEPLPLCHPHCFMCSCPTHGPLPCLPPTLRHPHPHHPHTPCACPLTCVLPGGGGGALCAGLHQRPGQLCPGGWKGVTGQPSHPGACANACASVGRSWIVLAVEWGHWISSLGCFVLLQG